MVGNSPDLTGVLIVSPVCIQACGGGHDARVSRFRDYGTASVPTGAPSGSACSGGGCSDDGNPPLPMMLPQ